MQELIEKIEVPLDSSKDQKIVKTINHYIELYPDYLKYMYDFDAEEKDYSMANLFSDEEEMEEKSLEEVPTVFVRLQGISFISRTSITGICLSRSRILNKSKEKPVKVVLATSDADELDFLFLNIKQAQEIQEKLVEWRWPSKTQQTNERSIKKST